jgi:hypothetical protein
MFPPEIIIGRDSVVGRANRYPLDTAVIESHLGEGAARFSVAIQTGPEAHPASCTMNTKCFPGAKRPGCDSEHSLASVPTLSSVPA